MVLKLTFIIISLTLFENVVDAQGINIDSIYWNKNYKLKWSDFQGVSPSDNTWKAVSYASIDARGYMDGGLPKYRVINAFLRKKSWTIDALSMDLLEHEQLHFDIAELYARKIKKTIEDLRRKKIKNYDRYEPLILRLMHERQAMDVKYDNETHHSMNVEAQSVWCKMIAIELDKLKKYASDR